MTKKNQSKIVCIEPHIISNTDSNRTGQLMDLLRKADRKKPYLDPCRNLVLVERNEQHLEEILKKILPEFCPKHIITQTSHQLPHYATFDGLITEYKNIEDDNDIHMIKARVKHPCSIAEKVPRKAVYFGRVSECHNKHKLMVGDINGLEFVTKTKEAVQYVVNRILELPFLKLEHYEKHRHDNGYCSDHLNMIYNNGNPQMANLEIEIQVTDKDSSYASTHDPSQAHEVYGKEKLESKHRLDRQLIIAGNVIWCPEQQYTKLVEEPKIILVKNKIQPYIFMSLPE